MAAADSQNDRAINQTTLWPRHRVAELNILLLDLVNADLQQLFEQQLAQSLDALNSKLGDPPPVEHGHFTP
jgi:hypothetical protein